MNKKLQSFWYCIKCGKGSLKETKSLAQAKRQMTEHLNKYHKGNQEFSAIGRYNKEYQCQPKI